MCRCLIQTMHINCRVGYKKTCLLLLILVASVGLMVFLQSNHGQFDDIEKSSVRHKSSFLSLVQNTMKKSTDGVEAQDSGSGLKCVHPVLHPFDPAVMQFHQKVPPINCSSAMMDWVYVINGTFHISRDAIRQYGNITCEYAPIVRQGDFSVGYASVVKPMLDGTPLQSDFFRVDCQSARGKTYNNIHAAVAVNSSVMERLRHFHSSLNSAPGWNKRPELTSSSLTSSLSSTRSTDHDEFSSQSYQNLNLSVFMLGFDSLSRMAWRRLLPKTHTLLVDRLGAIELEGYNILGDGTPAALLPILTGKMVVELPEARRGFKGAKPVDNHPWIWREFSKQGYVTAYAEDMPRIGTFYYRMLGFEHQPTDHCMRPFYLAAERAGKDNPTLCWGSKPRHMNFMNWFGSLFDMYRHFPKFFFGFYSEMSHNANNPAQAMDEDLAAFLQELEVKGRLNSTLLILMADHGARYDFIRATAQGRLEERLPFFSFRFPPWFRQQYPTIMKNLQTNSKRLTTPFDIHATFLDILNHSGTSDGNVSSRAISLFKEIPKERTCTHAEVTPHWCACLEWQPVSTSDPFVQEAVATAIDTINSYTQSERNKCAKLTLHNITRSLCYIPSSDDRSAEWKLLKYAKARRPAATELYQVSFQTLPGLAHFEATCRRDVTSKTFSVDVRAISRINKYGSQPNCVQKSLPHLRPYCYCV
ncbi:uncharacterized protein LOC143288202 [Babylonia areolata]|uniref:uncharacterized protein LOC143288202 n=1 Tax=Babylonia areolata TaxID=304850 RepID=UPI003FD674E6